MTCALIFTQSSLADYHYHCQCGYNPYDNGVTDPTEQKVMIGNHAFATEHHIWPFPGAFMVTTSPPQA